MNLPSKILENAVNELSQFPGIGKKTALRMVIYLMKQPEEIVGSMASAMINLKTNLQFCKICHNISEAETCDICNAVNRNKQLICVVKDFQDCISIESTGQYNGTYHVLNGLISPLDGIGPDDINISSLLKRVEENETEEVILALSATMEGDTTSFYLSKKLKEKEVKVTQISRGISIGGELEFADEITLGRSLISRVRVQ
ncbi:MAG: recombination protein RecR [Flavobacteriales bacterium]|nr:recombination protein RecR [Flavobacteriales bacterium]